MGNETTGMISLPSLSRRAIVAGAAALAVGGRAPGAAATEQPAAAERSEQFEAALAKISAGADIPDGPVRLDVPEFAENGAMVPFTVSVQSPMTEEDHVEMLTILSPANPQAVIASFYLTPDSGRAVVSGRLRLAKSQTLLAVARLANGRLFKGLARVEVTVGGCG